MGGLFCNTCECWLCLQEAGITKLLMAPGKLCDVLPGCSGTRNLSDNLSDLKAQVGTPLHSNRTCGTPWQKQLGRAEH